MTRPTPDPRLVGGLLCAAGFVLLGWPSLIATAVALEFLSAGFWCWARAADDRREQLPRWAWLRRPALAVWLAAGLLAVARDPGLPMLPPLWTPYGAAARIASAAVVWGALDLMAALPLARPASVRPGPLRATGPWLPAMLPAAGFLVMWRHADIWTRAPGVRSAALILLLVTAALAALRAFSRREWMSALRWLVIADCALGGALLALRTVPDQVVLLLWAGACAGHGLLLAGELAGGAGQLGRVPRRLGKIAVWVALTSLSLPLIASLGFGPAGVGQPLLALVAVATLALAALVSVRHTPGPPDRRATVRRESAVPMVQIGELGVMLSGPVGLVIAAGAGFRAGPIEVLAVLTPALGGWWAADLWPLPESGPVAAGLRAPARIARQTALVAFHGVMRFERILRGVLWRIGGAVAAPVRDLHTGDAQEYLLFLAGVAVLAVVLPLLR